MNNRINILLFSHTTPPIHGAAVIGDYVKEFIFNNYNNAYYINLSSASNNNSLNFFDNKIFKSLKNIIKFCFYLIKFRPNIIYFTPTVVNAGFYRDFIISIIQKFICALFFINSRFIFHLHMRPYKAGALKNNILFPIFFYKNEVIFNSLLLKSDYREGTFNFTKLYEVLNFVPEICPRENVLSNMDRFNDFHLRKISILYYGHLIESKGYKRALDIAKNLVDLKFDIKVNFYGNFYDVQDVTYFNDFVCFNNLQNYVHYNGFCDNENKKFVFSNTDIFILPSYSESYPLSILESMSFGIPVIATNTGAISDILTHETGVLVDQVSSEDVFIKNFISGIQYVLNNWNIECSMKSMERFYKISNIHNFNNKLLKILDYPND